MAVISMLKSSQRPENCIGIFTRRGFGGAGRIQRILLAKTCR